ncbi:MAG TPA: exodeoxyribonuclease VII small subunit [Solirubrobacteraceae bacterium]|nr:exodeoxyribonuclease VII small subunit [Solirubrobacteraceae bacterium]
MSNDLGEGAGTEAAAEPGADAQAQPTYEQASARVEEIIRRLDSGEAGLRETLDLVREGRELVEYCAGELDAVSQGLEELRLDELVARLNPTPPAPAGR